ncbi:hypothetical protein SAMN05720606_12531 [Paenibacillus polysaccharolyticus]|uniref:Uncharacterized protein n=1 Tax=Paenibacillus polysaccharolyticus TaxID=582692 RepID=A0A1G5LF58_9BACL|nr:hypothetical protein [Paenibacillus intestini]SCZ11446.1 hypothetical protein SAMN05720606_12531 [Paenibacillus polysaccharolyticus]
MRQAVFYHIKNGTPTGVTFSVQPEDVTPLLLYADILFNFKQLAD